MIRSRLEDFEYISRLKFASTLRYMTSHEAEDILTPGYFNNAGQFVEAADEIDVVCQHDDGSWTKGRLEVVSKTLTNVTVELLGKWRRGVAPAARKMKVHYVPGSKSWMVKADNEIIAKNLTKADAELLVGEAA